MYMLTLSMKLSMVFTLNTMGGILCGDIMRERSKIWKSAATYY